MYVLYFALDAPLSEEISNNLIHHWTFNIIPFGRLFVDDIRRIHFTRYGTCVIKARATFVFSK